MISETPRSIEKSVKLTKVFNILRSHYVSEFVHLPENAFRLNEVLIPFFNHKLDIFHTIGNVSFDRNSSVVLHHSVEIIFNALYTLKVSFLIPFH